jgi:hypothetical protein
VTRNNGQSHQFPNFICNRCSLQHRMSPRSSIQQWVLREVRIIDGNPNRKLSTSLTSDGILYHLALLTFARRNFGLWCISTLLWLLAGNWYQHNLRPSFLLPYSSFSVPTIHYLLPIQRSTFLIYARKSFIPCHSSISRLLSWNSCMNAIKMAIQFKPKSRTWV